MITGILLDARLPDTLVLAWEGLKTFVLKNPDVPPAMPKSDASVQIRKCK